MRNFLMIKKIFSALTDPFNFLRYRSYYIRKYSYVLLKILFIVSLLKRKMMKYKIENRIFSRPINKNNGYEIYIEKKVISLTRNAVEEANKLFKNFKISQNHNKNYFIRISEKRDFNEKSEIFKLAKSHSFLRLVSDYLGVFPILTNVNIYYTPKNSSNNIEGSQLFHLDHEEFKQIKCFIYCNDVDNNSGPLMIYPKEHSTLLQRKINYKLDSENKRITDQLINKEKLCKINAKKGTVIFADTSSCFHAGARSSKKTRLVICFQYLTPFAFVRNTYKQKTYKNILSKNTKFDNLLSNF